MAGCVSMITKFGNRIAVFFFTAVGEFVELFDDPKSAFKWIIENNLEFEEPVIIDIR